LATDKALATCVRGALVEECTHGLVFYIGAVLIARGTYAYLQMVETLNLVVFSVTIGSQLIAFSKFLSVECCYMLMSAEKIARSGQAASDFNRLLQLELLLDITSTDSRVSSPQTHRWNQFQQRPFLLPRATRSSRSQEPQPLYDDG